MVLADRQGGMRSRRCASPRSVAGDAAGTLARLRLRGVPRVMIPGRLGALAAALVLGAVAPSVFAQPQDADLDNLEVTMRLLPQGATRPDPVTRVIELPEALRSQLADGPGNADPAREGAGADVGVDRFGLPDEALRRADDGARTDLARSAVERARELDRGQGAATASRRAAEPAAGRDTVAAAPAAADTAATPEEQGREAAAADTLDAAPADARDAAAADARAAATEAREREREIADRARDAREEAARERVERAEGPGRGRPALPERPEPRRGRPDGPPGRP